MTAELFLPYKHTQRNDYAMQFYFGPNKYEDLRKLGNGMEGIVPLGWGFFSWFAAPINRYCIIPLFDLFSMFISNYGIIILLMTVLIKVVLMPFTYRSLLSAAKMKVIKPEIDELKAKYKDDQAKFGQEQLKLFQKAGVSPLGGCLPMALQLPFLVAMYSFFPISIELRQKAFLWATDLSSYDSIYNFPHGFSLPWYGDHVSLFTLLMTATSILTAVYNNQLNSVSGQAKWMQYIFPIMLLGIFNNLPAALTYYYFLSNVITFGLQWIVQNYFLDHAAIHKQIQERKKMPAKKKSGFLARLEEMQREQAKKRG
jgi:YidC/Oxa1 family membrane protein insertase